MPELEPFAQPAFSALNPFLLSQLVATPLPSLGEGPRASDLVATLNGLANQPSQTVIDTVGGISPRRVNEWLSGLWLIAGDLDRSHTLSQSIANREGSFLHAIMHRREGDFGNAKYWFNRVGNHPVLLQLDELTNGEYQDGCDFVDSVARVVRKPGDLTEHYEKLQWIEWQALMSHCFD